MHLFKKILLLNLSLFAAVCCAETPVIPVAQSVKPRQPHWKPKILEAYPEGNPQQRRVKEAPGDDFAALPKALVEPVVTRAFGCRSKGSVEGATHFVRRWQKDGITAHTRSESLAGTCQFRISTGEGSAIHALAGADETVSPRR